MNNTYNPLTYIDGYKIDHRRQYRKGITRVLSNWTPRGTRIPEQNQVVFFGFQYFLLEYIYRQFNEGFFQQSKDYITSSYSRRINGYLGPNNVGTQHIADLHDLGYLPLKFCALPEGTSVPLRVPMLQVENTHDDFFWLTNYIETLMSNILWMPCTSATSAKYFREILEKGAKLTGSPKEFIDWQGHDFSFRGMPGIEAASLSGAGHLLFFTGTDTIPAIDLIEDYYSDNNLPADYLIAGSVAATEHSVMCAGGERGEKETFEHLLDVYPEGIVSVVSDTWDLWNVLTNILPSLKERIMGRNGKLVVRPDSGNPADIICGNPSALEGSPACKGVIQLLWDVFGGTMTDAGYKLLDSHIGCIYGDSINKQRATEIINRLAAKGFASANMVFGIGSYNYQYVTRDTYNFAMKATHVTYNGEGLDIFKKPITDEGQKNSAKGRLAVTKNADGKLILVEGATPEQEEMSSLRPVWENGKFLVKENFKTIRERARSYLNS